MYVCVWLKEHRESCRRHLGSGVPGKESQQLPHMAHTHEVLTNKNILIFGMLSSFLDTCVYNRKDMLKRDARKSNSQNVFQ